MTTVEWRRKASKFDPILVVSSERGTAAGISSLLRGLGPVGQLMWTGDPDEAWRYIEGLHPKLIFMEQGGRRIDGLALTQRLRQSPTPGRRAPVIMLSSEATVAAMRAAQKAGADEYLVRPFSAQDLARRLQAICTVERAWIESDAYVGPDRRRFNSAAKGPERRGRRSAARLPQA